MSIIIPKPWGREIILTEPNLPYTGKIAFTLAIHRWSLQYHDQKTETITLLSGKANLTIGATLETLETFDMISSTGYTIKPNTIHRFTAITDCVTVEVSTPERGTTFRLEDDYQRGNEIK
jgi:mannose-6-phosphate isomerase